MNKSVSTDAELRGFLKAICSPTVYPFISREKLVRSEQFSRLIQIYDEHFDRHRDVGSFERILAMLDGSKYRDVLAEYLRLRHGVQVSRVNGKIKVSVLKAVAAQVKNDLNFARFLINPESVVDTKPPKKMESGRHPSKKGYVDALDHPARLPGSFGHGRRT